MNKKIALILLMGILTIILPPANAVENTCIDCHKGLEIYNATEKQFNEIRLKHLERDVGCSLECHADTIAKIATSNYEQWSQSKHALVGTTCDKCHGGNPEAENKTEAHQNLGTASDKESPVYYQNLPETCGKCHTQELEQFKNSAHFQKLKALEQAPTCSTCHNPHTFKILDPTNLQITCQNCHNTETDLAPADVPLKARKDLESIGRLKSKINRVEEAINKAQSEGQTIPQTATTKLNSAKNTLNQIPIIWHRFDLPVFEGAINKAVQEAQEAETEIAKAGIKVTQTPETETSTEEPTSTTPETPAFGLISTISIFLVMFLVQNKKNKQK